MILRTQRMDADVTEYRTCLMTEDTGARWALFSCAMVRLSNHGIRIQSRGDSGFFQPLRQLFLGRVLSLERHRIRPTTNRTKWRSGAVALAFSNQALLDLVVFALAGLVLLSLTGRILLSLAGLPSVAWSMPTRLSDSILFLASDIVVADDFLVVELETRLNSSPLVEAGGNLRFVARKFGFEH